LYGLAADITAQIAKQIPLLESGIAALQATREHEFVKGVKPTQIIAQVADQFKLTTGANGQARQTVKQFSDHESAFRNLYGVINAVTRVAQNQEPAEHHRLEAVGGELARFDNKAWNRLNILAGSMAEDKYNKILGVTI
jgi:hypothetical protein